MEYYDIINYYVNDKHFEMYMFMYSYCIMILIVHKKEMLSTTLEFDFFFFWITGCQMFTKGGLGSADARTAMHYIVSHVCCLRDPRRLNGTQQGLMICQIYRNVANLTRTTKTTCWLLVHSASWEKFG